LVYEAKIMHLGANAPTKIVAGGGSGWSISTRSRVISEQMKPSPAAAPPGKPEEVPDYRVGFVISIAGATVFLSTSYVTKRRPCLASSASTQVPLCPNVATPPEGIPPAV